MQNKSVLILLLVLLASLACSGSAQNSNSQNSNSQAQQEKPQVVRLKVVKPQELKQLRWIEGSWRGTGDVDKPFYERYRFEDDFTLLVESFDDETFGKVTDVTRFKWKDGVFGNEGDGARWAVSELDENSITFVPTDKARNSFRWQRESQDLWKAILDWPASDGKPARQRVYRMERWPPAKG